MRYAQVAQVALQLGDLAQPEVTDEAAVTNAQLAHHRAVDDQEAQALIGQAYAASQVQVRQLRAVSRDDVQTLVLQRKAIAHVQVADGDLLAVQRREFDGRFPRQTDACHLRASCT